MTPVDPPVQSEAPPPVLGSWRRVYAAVLGVLAAVVAGLWALTRMFA